MGKLEQTLSVIRPAVRAVPPYKFGSTQSISVKLNQNENPFDLPQEIKDEIVQGYMAVPFNRYPNNYPERLFQALADYTGWRPDGFLLGNGSNEILYTIMMVLERGANVVLPCPMFSLYEMLVRLHEATLVEIAPRTDLSFDSEMILRAVRQSQPALTVLATPNNPTGLSLSLNEIEPIVAEASGFVIVDEAYVEFSEEESAITILEEYPNLLLLRTLSKAIGLAGLRVGYMMGHPDVLQAFTSARPPFMIDRLTEMAAVIMLRHRPLIQERVAFVKREVRRIYEALATMGTVEAVPTQANFVLFRTHRDADQLLSDLARQGVLVRNMTGYKELPGYLRVTAGTKAENKEFLAALKRSL